MGCKTVSDFIEWFLPDVWLCLHHRFAEHSFFVRAPKSSYVNCIGIRFVHENTMYLLPGMACNHIACWLPDIEQETV